jgi:predicted ribosome quality control (RQC) complex YloA/Tae2 family protein
MAFELDAFGVGLLAGELHRALKGQIVDDVRMGENRLLRIILGGPGPGALEFFHDAAFPLLFAGGGRRGRPGDPGLPRFENPLRGSTITGLEQPELDRVIRVDFGDGSRPFSLYFELTPPFPNAFLTDGSGTLLAVLLKSGTRTRRRTLLQGRPYLLPPAGRRISPLDASEDELGGLDCADPATLTRRLRGVGPFLAGEICARAEEGKSPAEVIGDLTERFRERQSTPSLFRTDPGLGGEAPYLGVAWFAPQRDGVTDIRNPDSLSEACRLAMGRFVSEARLERKRAVLARSVSREIRRWNRTAARTRESVERGAEADRLRRMGELLTANMARLEKGMSQVRVPDLYGSSGCSIEIPLDPRLNPQANARSYFKRARKTERRAALARERLEKAREKLAGLESLARELTRDSLEFRRLEEIEDLLGTGPEGGAQDRTVLDERAARLGIKPRRFTVSGGWTVLVGRSARENDTLTHRYARPGDLWFHARKAQGSHVVLRRERKTQVPLDALLEAAAIAAHYSKARTSRNVPVSYTEKRYVKKVRKGPPGLCVMLREKVLFVDPALPERSEE